MHRLIVSLLAALSSTHAKAAIGTGSVAALAASASHADPWPWMVSAVGALVVIVKFPAVERLHGLTNAVISVLIGGLGSGFVAEWLARTLGIDPGQLLVAFVLSALWPCAVAAVQQLWPALAARAEQKIRGQ